MEERNEYKLDKYGGNKRKTHTLSFYRQQRLTEVAVLHSSD
jgi:hypothetical protein